MAIRFEYNPGATGGLAAYAAGSGRRRQRELKYAADLAVRGQERRDRYNLLGQQQQFALEMELGRSRREALREVGRETARLGERKYAADLALDRDEMAAKRAEATMKRADAAAERKRYESAADGLDIPDSIVGSNRTDLEKMKATIKSFVKPDMDLSDPDVRKPLNDELERFYNKLGSNLKTTSPAEAMKEGIAYLDPVSGGLSNEFKAGSQPYQRKSSGEWVPLEQPKEQAGEEYRSKVTKIADQLEKEVDETSLAPVYKSREEALEAAAKKVAADEKFFNPPQLAVGTPGAGLGARKNSEDSRAAAPQAPQPSGGGATGAWGEVAQAGAASTRPLPDGVPPTSTWISDDTIRLPDGRVIRRKKE